MDVNHEPNGILIVCEETDSGIHRVAFELLNKAQQIAKKIIQPVECIFISSGDIDVNELGERGADKVFVIENKAFDNPLESLLKENLVAFIKERKPYIVLFGATELGRSLAPRVACALETGLTADCTDLIINESNEFIQVRPAFSDNILAHIKTVTSPKMSTVRYHEFEEASKVKDVKCKIINIPPYSLIEENSSVLKTEDLGEKSISEAELIVSVGRGLKAKEDLAIFKELADKLGGMLGVSRAIVDAGIAPSNIQIGYSGHRVKPKIYIACGISGAPQHLSGMKESDTIIAINKDPSAPIFQIADIGYVGDMYEIVPMLMKKIKRR